MRTFAGTAAFHVDLPPERARELFTAEGERRWAGPHWDPHYPDAERREGRGAVFVTAHGADRTVWVMVDAEPLRVRYVHTTAGDAGTVEVSCREADGGGTTATVTYDLTALDAAGEARLDELAAGYDAFVASWGEEIAAALSGAE